LRRPSWEGFFAATALAKELTPITRNVSDLALFSVLLLNSWDQ